MSLYTCHFNSLFINLVYKTTNATADSVVWKRISDGMGKAAKPYGTGGEISAVTMDPTKPERVWVSIRNFNSPSKVMYSSNGGDTWESVSNGLPPYPVNDILFQAGTEDAIYVGTDVGVYYKDNNFIKEEREMSSHSVSSVDIEKPS